jgi:ABC-type bacteriocin/lantibiotic exporter with double-glycine peptidase domain
MPEGLSAQEALWRFLQLRGRRTTRQELLETWRGEETPESMLLEFEARGIDVRIVAVQPGDLPFLELPALIQRDDGTWFLFDGSEPIEASASLNVALEILPRLPEGASLWHRLAAVVLRRRGLMVQIAGASLLLMLLILIPPQMIRIAIDRALPSGAASTLEVLALALLCVAVFQAWAGWLRARTILYLKTSTETTLGRGFLSHLLSLPFPFLSGKTKGQLLQGFSGLNAAQELLTDRALGAVLDGMSAVLYLVVMVSMMPAPTLVVVCAVAVIVTLAVVVGQLQARLQRKETEAQSEERDFLVELLSGASTIKALAYEEQGLHEWVRRLRKELSLALRRQRIGLWSDVGLETIGQALTVVILVWGGRLVLDGQTTIGGLLAFLQMSTGFTAAMMGLVGTWLAYIILKPQLAMVTEALAHEPPPRPPGSRSKTLAGPIVLENVWFRYASEAPWVLREYDLEVQQGEKRWISGPSGFGKSTILRLISGLYPPGEGSIRIGGREPAAAREALLYLPQIVQLYGGSIYDNLAAFSGHATRQRIMEAAEESGLHARVGQLPMGYDTVLPPGGATLSGGERQLVVLTAVMASDRSVFLLDEALANLDWVSRGWVEKSPWFDGKTVIYASHDSGF